MCVGILAFHPHTADFEVTENSEDFQKTLLCRIRVDGKPDSFGFSSFV